MISAIIIDRSDNVAMVTAQVEAGQEIIIPEKDQVVKSLEAIGPGHKVALTRLEAGETVIKYGIPIGRMISTVEAGGWISTHNLEDTTEELCGEYCKKFREGARKIKAYPRENGSFGIRNYIMVIPTSPDYNIIAEAISDKTGCAWFVCDRTRLEQGELTDYTKKAMIYTGRNPNLYAVLIIGTASEGSVGREVYAAILETGKPVRYLSGVTGKEEEAINDGISIIEQFQRDASKLKRELVSMEGFGLSVHCSGSDWTTAINGNSSVGAASDIIVKNGGRVFMTEWMEWSGSQHLLAEQCATHELGLELLDTVDKVRATVLRETGLPVEHMNPAQANKDAGLTTLVEKSTGTIRKVGSTPIQGLLDYCEQPAGKGVWLPKHDSVWPPTTAIYGSLSGAHMSILVTGIGFLYFELPHMICVRATGNPVTYNNEAFKIDFNAGIAFDGLPIPVVGEKLFDYLIKVAEGDEDPNTEHDKDRAFNMYYYTENEFGKDTDRSRILPCGVMNYRQQRKEFTDRIK